jgi:hypothetical protein
MSNLLVEALTGVWYIGYYQPQRKSYYNPRLKDFERRLRQSYPLGDETFHIDHGRDYFAFFERMGDMFYFALTHPSMGPPSFVNLPKEKGSSTEGASKEEVFGSVCYVLQDLPLRVPLRVKGKAGPPLRVRVAYLCDLKIDPRYRGLGYTNLLWTRTIPTILLRTRYFYAISMNPKEGESNPILEMGKHQILPWGRSIEEAGKIVIYSLSEKEFYGVFDVVMSVKRRFGTVSFLSLEGIKDIIIDANPRKGTFHQKGPSSEGTSERRLNLFHLYHPDGGGGAGGGVARGGKKYLLPPSNPLDPVTIMFCTPKGSYLHRQLLEAQIKSSGEATIIAYGLETAGVDWEFIQTCNI